LEDRSVPAGYVLTDLVSDIPGAAVVHDPELVNAWGIVPGTLPTSAWWISCQGTGLSTLYTGDVTQPDGSLSKFVKGTLTVTLPGGSPTGQIFNGNATDFFISAKDGSGNIDTAPAKFITVSDAGHLTGWAATVPSPPAPSRNAQLVGTTEGAVYTGLAIGVSSGGGTLYAADFRNGEIDTFDRTFAPTTLAGDFVDPGVPDNYAPFNIQNLGGKLYVAYGERSDGNVPENGHGIISVFDTNGQFLNRLVTKNHLKSPWGMALAPANFGELSGALLVANHGDGRINAYDPVTGKHLDRIRHETGEPVKIDGLFGLHFGNGLISGDKHALYFTAGPDDGAHGLMGSIRAADDGSSLVFMGVAPPVEVRLVPATPDQAAPAEPEEAIPLVPADAAALPKRESPAAPDPGPSPTTPSVGELPPVTDEI
jgi:uncharacterized protein (TIGR03118 family)